jgi:hypothetical protein
VDGVGKILFHPSRAPTTLQLSYHVFPGGCTRREGHTTDTNGTHLNDWTWRDMERRWRRWRLGLDAFRFKDSLVRYLDRYVISYFSLVFFVFFCRLEAGPAAVLGQLSLAVSSL